MTSPPPCPLPPRPVALPSCVWGWVGNESRVSLETESAITSRFSLSLSLSLSLCLPAQAFAPTECHHRLIGEYAYFIGRARVTFPARNSLLAWNANDKGFPGNRAIFNGGAANRGTSGMRIVHFGIFRTRGAERLVAAVVAVAAAVRGMGWGERRVGGEVALMAARVAWRRVAGARRVAALFLRKKFPRLYMEREQERERRGGERERKQTTRIVILRDADASHRQSVDGSHSRRSVIGSR